MKVKMNIVLFTTVAILMMLPMQSKCEEECINWNDPLRICGSRLSDVMKEICQGKYYDPTINSDTNRIRRGVRIGIVNECCYTSCTAIYLRSRYCADADTFIVGDDPRPCVKIPKKDDDYMRTLQYIYPKTGKYEWGI